MVRLARPWRSKGASLTKYRVVPGHHGKPVHALQLAVNELPNRPPRWLSLAERVNSWCGVACKVAQHLHLVDRRVVPAQVSPFWHLAWPGNAAGKAVSLTRSRIPIE